MSWGSCGTEWAITIYGTNDLIGATVCDVGIWPTSANYTRGSWQHISTVYDSSAPTVTYYVVRRYELANTQNGVTYPTWTRSTNGGITTPPDGCFHFGNRCGNANNITGYLTAIRIWDTALIAVLARLSLTSPE